MQAAKTFLRCPVMPQNLSSFITPQKTFKFSSLCLKPSSCSILTEPLSTTPAKTKSCILTEALPFIQKFRSKTIVVKYDGAVMKSEALQSSLITDLALLSLNGFKIVFVHGGGPEINQSLNRLGIKPSFLDGLRVTDASNIEMSMLLTLKVNQHLVGLINKTGARAVGLCGTDGRIFTAVPSPNSAQLGLAGEIASVDTSVLRPLINDNLIPVIASVAADGTGQSYNINSDTAAGELAAALGAEKLLLLSDIAGILEDKDDPDSLVKNIDVGGVKKMMKDEKIADGMIRMVNCCVKSLDARVKTASIIDGLLEHSLLLELLTVEGAGTIITGNLSARANGGDASETDDSQLEFPFCMTEKDILPPAANDYSESSNGFETNATTEKTLSVAAMKHALRFVVGTKHLFRSMIKKDLKREISIQDVITVFHVSQIVQKYPRLANVGPMISLIWLLFKVYSLAVAEEEKEMTGK